MLRAEKFGGLPRKLRVQYPDAIYHVMNRGDRREDIFLDDPDRLQFLDTLGEACEKTDWVVQAYCLMRNHFHLVVETPRANLAVGMQWLLGTYTARFNRRHRCSGHLFSGRYKALIVDGSANGYLKAVGDYVHLNPVRAKLLPMGERLDRYRWSSYPFYLKAASWRPKWLRVERLLGEWGIGQDNAAGRGRFKRAMERRKQQEQSLAHEDWKSLRRGWCWGPTTFREELLELVAEQRGEHHVGDELWESAEQKAQRLLEQMLARAGWTDDDLRKHRKGDPAKVQLAARMRTETTMSWKWIAEKLRMGHWRSAANAVRSAGK